MKLRRRRYLLARNKSRITYIRLHAEIRRGLLKMQKNGAFGKMGSMNPSLSELLIKESWAVFMKNHPLNDVGIPSMRDQLIDEYNTGLDSVIKTGEGE
jgi:hypothetical protein